MAEVFAFECRYGPFTHTVNALNRSKARYGYLLDVRESYPDATFADIEVRKVGPAITSAAFRRTAQSRGLPDLRCGEHVTVDGMAGIIVGHNDSANFDVVFPERGGHPCNVHPSEMRRATPPDAQQEASHG